MSPLPLKRILGAALLACLCAAPLAAQDPGDLFDEVVTVLEKRYHDKQFRTRELPSIAAQYRPYALEAQSLWEEREIIHAFLGKLPASHLAIYSTYAQDVMTKELFNRDRESFGFQITELDGRHFVSTILEGSPAAKAGLLRGDRVLEIDGIPVLLSPRLDWRTDDAALPDPPVHAVICEEDDALSLLVERRPGAQRELRVESRPYSAWRATKASRRIIERGKSRIGYLHFWYFHMKGMKELLAETIRARFQDCEALILDMRGRGGSAFAVQVLIGALTGAEPLWDGPLIVLLDSNSRSAKEVFAYEFKQRNLGLIVGETTAGAVIPATFADLGQDTVLMYPAFTLGKYTELLEGRGVEPDVPAPDRLPYAAGRDPILEAGVRTALELAAAPM